MVIVFHVSLFSAVPLISGYVQLSPFFHVCLGALQIKKNSKKNLEVGGWVQVPFG